MNRPTVTHLALTLALLTVVASACGSSDGAVVTSGGAALSTVTIEDFVIDYPCGYSFQVGSEDQTLMLKVVAIGVSEGSAGAIASGPADLPSENWQATLKVGENLAANWCDDVMEPDEPVRRVDATFPVRGHLDVVEAGDGARSATITATDLVVDPLDGPPILLGDIQITNSHFGVIAG